MDTYEALLVEITGGQPGESLDSLTVDAVDVIQRLRKDLSGVPLTDNQKVHQLVQTAFAQFGKTLKGCNVTDGEAPAKGKTTYRLTSGGIGKRPDSFQIEVWIVLGKVEIYLQRVEVVTF